MVDSLSDSQQLNLSTGVRGDSSALRSPVPYFDLSWDQFKRRVVQGGQVMVRRIHRLEIQDAKERLYAISRDQLPEAIVTSTGDARKSQHIARILLRPESVPLVDWQSLDLFPTASRFGRDDLPLVSKVTDLAHTWIYQQGSSSADTDRNASSSVDNRSTNDERVSS